MSALTFPIAMKLLTQKKYQEVYELAVQTLRQNEKDPLAFFFLGIVASDHGEHEKALELFGKASEHGPKTARYHAYHAKQLMTLGRRAEAKSRADIAAALKIEDAFVADIIGTVYSRSGHHTLALPLFKQAVKLNPDWVIFQFNLGASAQFTGDIETARSAYKKAVSLDPKFYRAWFSLVSLETQNPQANHLETLQRLFSEAGLNANAQLLLGHSIAKTLEDMGQFPESFEWLVKAKSQRKVEAGYNQQSIDETCKAAKSTALTVPLRTGSTPDITPIFIVGLPRTGTTLIDRILSSHSQVMSAGELDLFSKIVRAKTRNPNPYSEHLFLSAQNLNLREIGDIYQHEIQELSDGSQCFMDKTPLNFFYIGLIHQALPEAKIITLRRGAMDSCLSNYRQLFALGDVRYNYALGLEDMADYYRQFDKLMAHWREALPDNRYMEISYENIVQNQEPETRRLLEFCGLDWEEACLRFHENAAPTDTASSVQVRQPLYSGAIGRWKKYGDTLEGLKIALGDLAER